MPVEAHVYGEHDFYLRFGKPVTEWTEMREALASYATRAAEKMPALRRSSEVLVRRVGA